MAETESERIKAFQQLAEECLDTSYRLANAILGDESQSQDAVHDAVVQAWQRWSSLRDRAKFNAWFDRIVVNECRGRLRGAKYRRTADMAEARLTSPDATAEVHQRLFVEQALRQLKPDDIVVLTLRHYLDLQLEDVLETGDARLDGTATVFSNLDVHRGSGADKTMGIFAGVLRIENDDGAWQGQPTIGVSFPDGSATANTMVLEGEGAYAGLTAILELTVLPAGEGQGWTVKGAIVGEPPPAPAPEEPEAVKRLQMPF